MKQKVTITLTIEPRDYGLKGNATNAVTQVIAMLTYAPLPMQSKVRVTSGKVVRYYTRATGVKYHTPIKP